MNGRGLGFGVGREPIVGVLARHGAQLVLTDLADAEAHGWENMEFGDLVGSEIQCRNVDMNAIPYDLHSFDFLWSCGSLEHIGGLQKGMDFINNSLDCLRPGGLAVHTTEFNYSSNGETFESPGLSFYRQSDIEALASRLRRAGHRIELNLNRGTHPMDYIVSEADGDPWEISLRVKLCGHVITSVGIIIECGEA